MGLPNRSGILYLAIGICLGLVSSIFIGDSANRLSAQNNHVEVMTHGQSQCDCKCPTEAAVPIKSVKEIMRMDVPQMNGPQIMSIKQPEPEVMASKSPRKILLDCGANVASTALLFRETYPGGTNFTIHSFEIDDRLAPYFQPYDNLHIHCPVGVAGKTGTMTAYSEMPWSPDKGANHGADMQWGGGSLFVSGKELNDKKTGGYRQLSYRKTIPVIDLSKWIMDTFSIDDYIIFKLDVEGAEYEILRKMIDEKALAYIDKFYGEFHDWQPTGWTKANKEKIRTDIAKAGLKMIDWVGERRKYGDIDKINPIKVPPTTPGKPGEIYTHCASGSVALTVAVGMNYKRAHRVVTTLAAHKPLVPTTLFVYGDFVQTFPETVKSWAKHFTIGIREDGHNPPGHLELMSAAWVRMGLISAILRLEEVGITASYYLPTVARTITPTITGEAKNRGLRIVKAAVEFPAEEGSNGELTWDNYYRHRDVERVPKALRKIHDALAKNQGGILTLDTDLPDTYMNSVFMMDYLVETSGFKMVFLDDCIAGI